MKLVRDFFEVKDHVSLDDLIRQLTELRSALPDNAAPEIRMRGDDVFGRKLCISYLRPQTAAEAALDARYAEAYESEMALTRPWREQQMSQAA